MNRPRKRISRLGPGTLLVILIIAYVLSLLGANDLFGYSRHDILQDAREAQTVRSASTR